MDKITIYNLGQTVQGNYSKVSAKRHTVIVPYRRLFDLRLSEIWTYRSLLAMLTWREITIRYQQAVLGVMWVVLQPVVNLIIYATVFGLLLHAPSEEYPYVIYLFPALIAWRLMGDGIGRGSLSLTQSSNTKLIEKVYFPRLLIVLAAIFAVIIDFLVSLVILLIAVLLFQVTLTWHILFIPLYTALAVVTILAVCVWLAPLNVRYRDVTHILPFLVQISLYTSPILYPITLIPEKFRWIYGLNPITNIVQGFRWCILGDSVAPDLIPAAIGFCLMGAILLMGLAFFKRSELTFADNI